MQENNVCVKELLANNGRMEPVIGFDIDLDAISLEIERMDDLTVTRSVVATRVEETTRVVIDDCPELLDIGRTPVEKVAMHLSFLRAEMEAAPHVTIKPEELTKYVKQRYGVLLDNVTKLLRKKMKVMCKSDADINWVAAAELEKRGFVVTYDKTKNVVSVAVFNSAIIV